MVAEAIDRAEGDAAEPAKAKKKQQQQRRRHRRLARQPGEGYAANQADDLAAAC